jgi:hypothetical protein
MMYTLRLIFSMNSVPGFFFARRAESGDRAIDDISSDQHRRIGRAPQTDIGTPFCFPIFCINALRILVGTSRHSGICQRLQMLSADEKRFALAFAND